MQIHDGSRDYKAIKEQPMQMRARYIPPVIVFLALLSCVFFPFVLF